MPKFAFVYETSGTVIADTEEEALKNAAKLLRETIVPSDEFSVWEEEVDCTEPLKGICVRCGGDCKADYDGALCSRCAGESGS